VPPPRKPGKPEETPPDPPRRPWWRRPAVAAALATALLAAGVAGGLEIFGGDDQPAAVKPLPVSRGGIPASRAGEIYARVEAGVVSVQVPEGGSGVASGTGFVIEGDGTIVTNAHVIGEAERAFVTFEDGADPVRADVIGTDPSSDLAVLRVKPGDVGAPLRPLPLADSTDVRVGDLAVAIGYPLGLDRTATQGIVSGVGREIRAPNGFRIDKVIQTDAPINPGNSGGPLLDERGRVIGVNSQIATAGSRGNVGIGFAVPSNTVRDVVPRLERGKAIERPFLGVTTTPRLTGDGAAVVEVSPGSPADKAGLEAGRGALGEGGDIILAIDGRPVDAPDDVVDAVAGRRPGETVEVLVDRGGTQLRVKVKLGVRPTKIP
jgi:putative serine protease PepD